MAIIIVLLVILCIFLAFRSLHYELDAKKYKGQVEMYKNQAELFDELLTESRKMMDNDTKLLKTLIQDVYPDIELESPNTIKE